jgi:hypothetical protein
MKGKRTDAPPPPAFTLLSALDDPRLFGGMFAGPSWAPWRSFLAGLLGLPMDDAQAGAFRHHTGRSKLPSRPFREACLVCGRRSGKSRVLALIATWLACAPDYSAHTAPGETLVCAIIAADRRQARVILGYVVGLLRAVPALAAMIDGEVLAESVRLTNGVTIEVHTASIGAPRGRTFICILADEIAFWASGDSANPDSEVIAAVRPGLASIPGSMLLMASSPYARRGVLFSTFSRYFGRDDAPVLVWRGATAEMNSTIDPELIAEAIAADPEAAASEYMAEFRSDISAFIGRDAIEAVVASGVRELPPGGGLSYVGFVDPSGGSADSFTLAIAHMGEDGVAVLDAVREVRPPFSPESVVEDFATLLRSYGIARVCGDAYGGEWPRERFAAHGIAYDLSKKPKSAIYAEFLPALNGRRVRLLDHARLVAQLTGLERRVARGGRDSIDHGPGAHDDVANAACGALVQVIADRAPALMKAADLLVEGAPVPEVARCDAVFAVLAIDARGTVATIFGARNRHYGTPLVLLDFDISALSGGVAEAALRRVSELARVHQAGHGVVGIWCPPALLGQFDRQGWRAHELPAEWLSDPAALALEAAAHVAAGRVKLAEPVQRKARTSAFGGLLEFAATADVAADPVRLAALVAIVLALHGSD